jgi:hypothetical protein
MRRRSTFALATRARDASRELKFPFWIAYCLAGLACVAALRGDAVGAGENWGRVERIEDETGDRLHGWERERYERILEPLSNDAAFRRGYEAGRVTGAPLIEKVSVQ